MEKTTIKNLDLFQFRNYTEASFAFQEQIVAICGPNGSGKTNLLDAIYYLCFTKSYFQRADAQSVKKGCSGFRIAADAWVDNEALNIACILRETGKKEFSVNQERYKRFSQHIGRIPCVMIAPDDVEIIQGASELRRKLLDAILSQLDQDYLQHLIDYNKVLLQRNSLLKSEQDIDLNLLDILDEQLVTNGTFIYEYRKRLASDYIAMVLSQYQMIALTTDAIDIQYQSALDKDSFDSLLQKNRQRDFLLQRTTSGIHRDDLVILMDGVPFKNIASQGQRKSLLFAIKLAEYQILKMRRHVAPILLLDDVFEKLDAHRMNHLLKTVCEYEDSMIFITDTHAERLQSTFEALSAPFQLIKL